MDLEIQDQVCKLLKTSIKDSVLPEFFFNYMAGIILEEPPNDDSELFQQIGDFIQNGQIVQKEKSQQTCKNIYKQLVEKKLINVFNKLTMTAERMDQAVTLNDCSLKQNEQNLYADAFLGREKFQGFVDEADKQFNPKLAKKKDKDAQTQEIMYKKHLVEIEKSKHKAPPTRVKHGRDTQASKELQMDNLTLIVGGRNLLEDARIQLPQGRKFGLVGRNGIGKTCLLTAIVRGEFGKIRNNLQILLVEQEIMGEKKSVIQTVLETDQEREELLQQERDFEKNKFTSEQISKVYERMTQIDAFNAETKASIILTGLGFTDEMQQMNTCDLSGGWRMRVSLARALFVDPDILMLDEPTNHLDLDAVMWLEDYLIKTKNTVVVVSHAREFLNIVCTDIIHFFDSRLTYYKGNYDQFEKTRNENLSNQKKQVENQTMKVQHMQSFIDKFRYNSKRASLVQSRIKALNKMDMIEEILEDPTCIFVFPTPEKLSPPLLKIEEGDFGYTQEKILLKGINFGVDMDSRIALVGANGVGKSTLLNLITEKLQLTNGQKYRNGRLRTSMFTQHHLDQLNLVFSPLEQFANTYPGCPVEQYRSHLANFGITGNLQIKPQYLMSGGQKSRVAFALNVWLNPHILIMDEPTNHLDLDAVNALIIALNNFQGGVLIVSHDQHLIASVCDQIWYLRDKRMKKFKGDFEDYRKCLQQGRL